MKYNYSPEAALHEIESPPSRGAWIEIRIAAKYGTTVAVAPLAGGVD